MNELDSIVGDLVSNNMTIDVDVFDAHGRHHSGYVECNLVVTDYIVEGGIVAKEDTISCDGTPGVRTSAPLSICECMELEFVVMLWNAKVRKVSLDQVCL
uniref:Uncharacterized protein n=1 Tax=Cannabis sativa TaxID=3483 RepID=A0A803NHM2_CANSA